MIELALAALLAAAIVVFVAVPFLREEAPPEAAVPPEEALAAAEKRDRVLAELKELEFDHRTGKVTDEDYRALVEPLRRQAARVLGNGAALPNQTAEEGSEQRFSGSTLSSGRRDR